jgi:hypothetical protein
MTNEQIRLALLNIAPEAKYNLSGDDYANIEWLSPEAKPSEAAVIAEIELLPAKAAKAAADQAAAKAALLAKLGITADEAALLLA